MKVLIKARAMLLRLQLLLETKAAVLMQKAKAVRGKSQRKKGERGKVAGKNR